MSSCHAKFMHDGFLARKTLKNPLSRRRPKPRILILPVFVFCKKIFLNKSAPLLYKNQRCFYVLKGVPTTAAKKLPCQQIYDCLGGSITFPTCWMPSQCCAEKLKSGAPFLLYLYYRFDNKPLRFKALWKASDMVREAGIPSKSSVQNPA